jgi:type IV pilus assembly protein PilW
MKSVNGILNKDNGFTMIELLIGIFISGILAACVVAVYVSQERAAQQVENMSAMQQNLRSALRLMEREIRMAGCDPTPAGNNGILLANAASIRFESDVRGTVAGSPPDGNIDNTIEPNEDISYVLNGTNLERNNVPIAENVIALDFVYLDRNGNVLNPGGADLALGQYANVRTVQLSILVQAPILERDYVNNRSFTNLQGQVLLGPQGDRFRRLLAVSSVRIRNL